MAEEGFGAFGLELDVAVGEGLADAFRVGLADVAHFHHGHAVDDVDGVVADDVEVEHVPLAVGRIGSATGPLLAGAMLGAGLGATQVLEVMAPLMVVAGLCAWWIGRTTRPADKLIDAEAAALANA